MSATIEIETLAAKMEARGFHGAAKALRDGPNQSPVTREGIFARLRENDSWFSPDEREGVIAALAELLP